ncbi:MAG: ATP-binding protein, partial [Halobacteria archaeon]|nr:ATP-binding protein [Halobacteria archaeon]
HADRFNHVRLPRLKISNLDVQDFDVAFPEGMNNVQRERLREILKSLDLKSGPFGFSTINPLQDKVRVNYSLDDMLDKLSDASDVDNAIAWQLSTLKDFQSLKVEDETSIEDMCEPGKCNIIEFPPGASKEELNLIVWHLTRRIFEARRRATHAERKGDSNNGEKRIDVPVMIVVEEAHNFAPADREVKTRRLLQEVAREGRKFGVGLGIISQRPSRLDEDVLSQCNSNIIMKIKNDVDQMAIKRSVEGAGEDLIRDLPGLTVGQAVLAGSFINTPVLAKIRERESRHGGTTPDVVRESVEAFRDLREPDQGATAQDKAAYGD